MSLGTVLAFEEVSFVRDSNVILNNISFEMKFDEHLVILGPNGAGKTTLIDIAGAYMFPTKGQVSILDQKMGKTDLAQLKLSIGYVGPRLNLMMDWSERVLDVVMSAAWGVVGRWQETYSEIDEARAYEVLEILGMGSFAQRSYGNLSAGEKKKVEIARALMNDPELLILDEPAASLDLPAREDLLKNLSSLIESEASPTILMVTHHIEEIPKGFKSAMLLNKGQVVKIGDVESTLTAENLSLLYGLDIKMINVDGRRFAYRA